MYLQARERWLSKQNYAFHNTYTDQAQNKNQNCFKMLFALFSK